MAKYTITLATVASIAVEVEADGEDEAVDKAYEAAREFSGQYHAGLNWIGDLNDEWQYDEPDIRQF